MRLTDFKPLTCPQCGEGIDRRRLREGACPSCHTDIGIAHSYRACVGLLALASIIRLGVTTYKPTSDGSWLLGVMISAVPLWVLFMALVPPWLKRGHNQPRITFVSSWLGAALTVFLVEFLGFGAAYLVLGASQRELRELLQMLSVPLAWISPNFLITPDKSFLDVCGIILGNSFFFGLPLFACYESVRWFFRKNRPVQLSITHTNPADDDD